VGRTRPLQRLAVFLAGAAIAIVMAVTAGGMVSGMAGLSPFAASALVSALICGLFLALSYFILRQDGAPLAALGLPADRHHWTELATGFLVTAVFFCGAAWIQSRNVGAQWHFQGARGVGAALAALPLVAAMTLAEELMFRGVALRYLRLAWGDRAAIGITAAAFGVYHVVGSGHWAMGAFFQFLLPSLGGLLFAWAAVRSNGLSLPIGLHLGGNWIQASVAGFRIGPAPGAGADAVWRIPISAADLQTLTAADVAVRLPYLTAIALAALVTWVILRTAPAARTHARWL
jgi:CAAX protease family protein